MREKKPNENAYEGLLKLIPSGVGIFDVTGEKIERIYLNEGYYQMIHSSKEQRMNDMENGVLDAIMPEDIPGLLKEIVMSIQEKRIFQYSLRILDGTQNWRWFSLQANHVEIEPGKERFFAAYNDIDEMVETQKKLKDNELIFRDMMRYSDTVHFMYYPEKQRYIVYERPERLDRMPMVMDDYPDSYIGLFIPDKAEAEKYREMIQKIDTGSREAECTVRICYQEKWTWYRVHCMAIKDAKDKTLRAVGYATNVDSFKQVEQSYQEIKTKIDSMDGNNMAVSIINATQDCIVELKNSETLVADNKRDSRIYQEAVAVEPEIATQNEDTKQLLLKTAASIPDKVKRQQLLQTFSTAGLNRLYKSGETEKRLEYRRNTSRGLIWVNTVLFIRRNPVSGDILCFSYLQDVDEQVIYRKMMSQIVEKNYESAAYFNLSNHRFYLKRKHYAVNSNFHNRQYEQYLTGVLKKEVSEEEWASVYEQMQIENLCEKLKQTEAVSIFYTEMRTQNKHTRTKNHIRMDVFYLDQSQDILIMLKSDVTAVLKGERENRKRLETALKEAEAANKAKTEFVSRISHDIRTPIGIIKNMTDFAMQDLSDTKALQQDLTKIHSANAFLLSLINDVLDISKIDSGKIELHPEPYSYEEHQTNVHSVLEPLCEEKGLHCVFERRNTNHGIIVVDKVRLNQIILNLISNAVKYTPQGGTITYISDTVDLPDNKIRFGFILKDTGIGMSKEFQKHMFDSFTQEYDNPNRPKGITGTGLGLSIVKNMVELMNGTLTVESDRKKGTVVSCYIILPDALRDPLYQVKKEENVMEESLDRIGGCVLMAEDNEINAEIVKRILEERGISCEWAENGLEAVKKFKESAAGRYQAILMDIQMPVMNGFEATVNIRGLSRADAKTIPIIAMTADAFTDALNKAMEIGMTDKVTKPIEPQILYKVLYKNMAEKITDRNREN